ncbi:MAG: hypothetical protein GTO03_01765 [Planctomycetales bacterium]|nr:hypothetical protein [Planctomycetales bacterium]
MNLSMAAEEVLQQEFLEIRARLLEVAAALDRLQRAPGDVGHDPRLQQIGQALQLLQEARPDRAEQIQLVFSRTYQENWQTELGMQPR